MQHSWGHRSPRHHSGLRTTCCVCQQAEKSIKSGHGCKDFFVSAGLVVVFDAVATDGLQLSAGCDAGSSTLARR